MRRIPALAAALAVGGIAAPALAHTEVGATQDLAHGVLHPLQGLDHMLAMVAVGLYAARLGGRGVWLLPSAFVGTLVVGGLLGYSGVPMPMAEQGIALSVIAMGAVIAFGVRLPAAGAAALVAAFALAHGHAHGSEGAPLAWFLPFAAGFVASTACLHGVGIAAGLALDRLGGVPASAAKGAAGAAGLMAGVAFLIG